MSYYITRIFNNKLKLGVILLFYSSDFRYIDGSCGCVQRSICSCSRISYFLGSFMTAGLQGVLTGYLPLFLAIIVADDCIEDYRIGYKNILITKRGKNKYLH